MSGFKRQLTTQARAFTQLEALDQSWAQGWIRQFHRPRLRSRSRSRSRSTSSSPNAQGKTLKIQREETVYQTGGLFRRPPSTFAAHATSFQRPHILFPFVMQRPDMIAVLFSLTGWQRFQLKGTVEDSSWGTFPWETNSGQEGTMVAQRE